MSTSNYAFGFRNDAAFPLLYSEDLIHWTFKGYAFPGGTWPAWAYMDMWAPELHFVNGVFTLYFSGRMKTTRKLALGVAVAKDLGDLFSSGFKDLGYPLLQVDQVHDDHSFFPQHSEGVIDPHFHRGENSNYLLWKTDNNAGGGESAIYIQELQEDGLAFVENTEAKMILKADLPKVHTMSYTKEFLRKEELWRVLGSFTGPNNSSFFTPAVEDTLTPATASGQQGQPA